MLNTSDVLETIRMIQDQNLDIRTITTYRCLTALTAASNGPAKRSMTRLRAAPKTW